MSQPASSGQDRVPLPLELATLLGQQGSSLSLRRTPNGLFDLMDIGMLISGKDSGHASLDVRSICERYPEFNNNIGEYHFPGRGRKDTATKVEPGLTAARVRFEAAKILVQVLGGDLALLQKIKMLRRVQESLATIDRPPMRALAAAVDRAKKALRDLLLVPWCLRAGALAGCTYLG